MGNPNSIVGPLIRAGFGVGLIIAANAACSGDNGGSSSQQPTAAVSEYTGRNIPSGNYTEYHLVDGSGTIPGSVFDPDNNYDEKMEREAVIVGLQDVKALQSWGICAEELTAESEILKAQADSITKFPDNKPYTNGKEEIAYDLNTVLPPILDGSKRVAAAAELARSAGIPCSDHSDSNVGQYVTFTGTDSEGKHRKVAVSDAAVLFSSLPVEFYEISGQCPSKLEAQATKDGATPISTEDKGMNTWGERDKYTTIKRERIVASMLRASGIDC